MLARALAILGFIIYYWRRWLAPSHLKRAVVPSVLVQRSDKKDRYCMSLDTILLVDLGIYTSGTGTRGHQLFAVPQYLRVQAGLHEREQAFQPGERQF